MIYDIIINLNNVIINQEKTNWNNQIIPNEDIILTIKEIQKNKKILLISHNSFIKKHLIKQWLKINLTNIDVLFFNSKDTLKDFKCSIFFDTDKSMLDYMKNTSKYTILVDFKNEYINEKYLRNTSCKSIKETIDYINFCLNLNVFAISSGKDISLLTIHSKKDISLLTIHSKKDVVSKLSKQYNETSKYAKNESLYTMDNLVKNALKNKPTTIYIPEIEKEKIRIKNLEKEERKQVIKDKILFVIHNKNAWNGDINIYCLTDNGDIFYIENFQSNTPLNFIKNTNLYFNLKNTINEKIKSINKFDLEKLLKIYNEIPNNDIQTFHSEKISMDAGITEYYMLNDKLSSNPILIGIRGDIDKHSNDIFKEKINNLLEDLLKNKL